ncbi:MULTISPECIES: PadR family transcriptional regulator [unclassified Kutzneria]|uniref:PadR family transcriptional regulator n=1 Tax=unclassified Kutzneria TaxID=2621979 RepID=UPI0003EEB052|nr:PadR family transcriptional regulator [Kutzneria sp. 744]EWM16765.1 transcriptional regulator [Kutzneria sp. 744]
MALRHAVLAVLLGGEFSGYQLAKVFDTGVANFWYASPQQLYGELAKLERAGLVDGELVIQLDRPNKRVYTVTEAGVAELVRFAEAEAKPAVIRDDLLVKVHAVDRTDADAVVARLEERAVQAAAKAELFDGTLRALRGDLDEDTFLATGERIGPYLTCLRGRRFEQENVDWCRRSAGLIRARWGAEMRDPGVS